MSYNLVIVESPAKAKTIEKFLGKNFKVVASIGHVRDLPKSKMGVDIEDNFDPKYINIRGKGDLIKSLKTAAKKADKVYLATDPDREGEAIAWHLAYILGISEDEACRVTFHEITKEAVKNAVKNPRTIDIKLVDAQQARRVLDRLVGYSISPILWRKVKKGLSAGRVQSVATRLICDREREILAFIPKEFWKIELNTSKTSKDVIVFDFYGDASGKIELENESQVDQIIESMQEQPCMIQSVETKKKFRHPAAPFITSSLQQEASNRFGFTTKKTMMLAQQLYEGISIKGKGAIGLITYMRTDSVRISDVAKESCRAYISESFGEAYLGSEGKKTKVAKSAQDAHEAIRPTYVELSPEEIELSLSKDQYKLYDLIWSRFVASQMASAEFEGLSVEAKVGSYIFKTTGSKLLFEGFLKVYTFSKQNDKLLPELNANEELQVKSFDKTQHFTQPPARFSEASLVKEMEEKGIGRPSTYAPTISTILSRGYVEKEKKNLKPTELGFIIDEIMSEYFFPIVDVTFTANMERRFDDVEEGLEGWKQVITDFYGDFDTLLKKADEAIEKVDLTEETDIPCDKCGQMMLIRHGRYGKFLACSNYPECNNTKPILKRLGIKCPECETGDIIERKTKKLKTFYGCSEFPECHFVSWDQPVDKKCPKCGDILVHKKTKKLDLIKCHNANCDYKEENEGGENA
ncbi:type I DNA topoisomerase [Fusibacter ferrireducens]|uniref:DNA topoisomerase 1 n=1 Tax=Fusibacter ferrireducens TaxID=2785058 RepID=A0ABR9ZMM2_9FIRM|nr:type I DNA topoisomerase [Fusibacter ferrireducens]MBF4691717.1 type I DNA topoisomerase [Fusibacter ferrireducens]